MESFKAIIKMITALAWIQRFVLFTIGFVIWAIILLYRIISLLKEML